jgi:hypothetical protein
VARKNSSRTCDCSEGNKSFIIGNGEGDYLWGLCQVVWRCPIQENGENFILDHFYIILKLEVGRKPPIALVGGVGGLMHASMLILRYPKSKPLI